MKAPLFSFIMPAFKRRFLGKAIDSILTQTYSDFELVVIDDASPENLFEVVGAYKDPRIRYEKNKENIGGRDLVKNWNNCLGYAKGIFVILATDDDYLTPSYLADALIMIEKYPNVDIVRQGVRKIGPNDEPLEYELFLKEYLSNVELAYFWGCCGLISCVSNFIFRRKTLLDQGGFIAFPHAHYSDVATALAMSKNGVACVQAWNVGFRMSDVNLSNRNDYSLVLEQLHATELFMQWVEKQLKAMNDDFFSRRAILGFRNQYSYMVDKLLCKIPKMKISKAIGVILCSRFLYKKEKMTMLLHYLIA